MDNNVTPRDILPIIMEGGKEDIKLQPFISPVNHNTLTSVKAIQIVHTLMGNFLSWRQGHDQSDGRYGWQCLFTDGMLQQGTLWKISSNYSCYE
jgi:hypothetical protein